MTKALVLIYLMGLAGCLWVSSSVADPDPQRRTTKQLVEGDQTFRGLATVWTSAFAFLCIVTLVRG
jgi:hypothetical protein